MKIVSKRAFEDAGFPVKPDIEFNPETLVTVILARLDQYSTDGINQAELWRELMNEGFKDDEVNIAMQLIRYRNQAIFIS